MARIIFKGDSLVDAKFLPIAKVKLSQLKRRMEGFGRRSGSLVERIGDALVRVSSSFGHDEIAIESFPSIATLYLCGQVYNGSQFGWRVENRDASGNLLWFVNDDYYTLSSFANGLDVDTSSVYVCGRAKPGIGNPILRIEKRSIHNGFLNWRIDETSGYSGGSNFASYYGVAQDADYIYLAGQDGSGVSYVDWKVEKRAKSDGSIVWQKVIGNTPGVEAAANRVFVDSTAVYFCGYIYPYWTVEARDKTTGDIIWLKQFTDLHPDNTGSGFALGLIADSNFLYVVGTEQYQSVVPFLWTIEKRGKTDGTLVWRVKFNMVSGGGECRAIVFNPIDPDNFYTTGRILNGGIFQRRIEKRSRADGSSIWIKDFSLHEGAGYAAAVDSAQSHFISAGQYNPTDSPSATYNGWNLKASTLDGTDVWDKQMSVVGGINGITVNDMKIVRV